MRRSNPQADFTDFKIKYFVQIHIILCLYKFLPYQSYTTEAKLRQ
jgi:hypothetical protein